MIVYPNKITRCELAVTQKTVEQDLAIFERQVREKHRKHYQSPLISLYCYFYTKMLPMMYPSNGRKPPESISEVLWESMCLNGSPRFVVVMESE